MQIRIVISGRSYDAAESIPETLSLPDETTVDEALSQVASLFPEGKSLPSSCLVAVSGTHLGTLRNHRAYTLQDGDELVVIAPVAGG